MFSLPYISICIYCMFQLAFLIVMENRRRNARSKREKYFIWMLVITLFSFAADILSSLNLAAWFFPFAAAGNYIEIILNTALLPIFFRYVCGQIFNLDQIVKRRLSAVLLAMTAVCMALVISTAFTGQIFYFDSANAYHRGPLFWLPMLILFAMMVIIEGFVINQKQKIEASYFKPLAFFLISPLIGWALQSFIFGLPFSLIGATFAAQLVFTNIQNRNIDKDYLTGAFNRQTLDSFMQQKIDKSTSHHSFSAILLDIDNFKSINDHHGHYEGDAALVNTVHILRDAVGHKDFIARYGGDEFCIILDSDDPKTVEGTLRQINSRLSDFNQNNDKPYRLVFSMGYAIYQLSVGNTAESFFKVIDQEMYKEKNARRVTDYSAYME